MKLTIEQENLYLPPIEINQYESVEVQLPSGLQIQVFSDVAYLRTPADQKNRRNGKAIWRKSKDDISPEPSDEVP